MNPLIPFAGSLLDRADAVRADADLLSELKTHNEAHFLAFDNLCVAMDQNQDLYWIIGSDLPEVCKNTVIMAFLGQSETGVPYFAFSISRHTDHWIDQFNCQFIDVRSAGLLLLDHRASIVAHARSILDWHNRTKYCSLCGAENIIRVCGHKLQCSNKDCAVEHFPRTDPVVIMLVESPDRQHCLLGRSFHYPPKIISALAGFMEPGESVEDAVRRETFEEAGIRCDEINYHASQPWPFPSTLMIGCLARATSTDLQIDPVEIEYAGWFSKNEVRQLLDANHPEYLAPQPIAIAYHLIIHWLEKET
jgi:NAD+ diphosphatase